jgi:hypothetical protein
MARSSCDGSCGIAGNRVASGMAACRGSSSASVASLAELQVAPHAPSGRAEQEAVARSWWRGLLHRGCGDQQAARGELMTQSCYRSRVIV